MPAPNDRPSEAAAACSPLSEEIRRADEERRKLLAFFVDHGYDPKREVIHHYDPAAHEQRERR